jgi:hypothetical protein
MFSSSLIAANDKQPNSSYMVQTALKSIHLFVLHLFTQWEVQLLKFLEFLTLLKQTAPRKTPTGLCSDRQEARRIQQRLALAKTSLNNKVIKNIIHMTNF